MASEKKTDRVIVYVDGFNLYFGMLESGLSTCKWLNLRRLVQSLAKPEQKVEAIKYFTSRVNNNPGKQKRQSIYIEALETVDVDIVYGRYQSYNVECFRCGSVRSEQNEKMTDVNIATHILMDAFQDKFDTAILISGDSDLVPPIRAVNNSFTKKRIAVFFPPARYNASVAAVAKGSMILGKKKLKDCQFESNVVKSDGFVLKRPAEWT